MKLATLRNGKPDGHLVVVSRDLKFYVAAGRIAPHLQAALDDWDEVAPKLDQISHDLNAGNIAGQPFAEADIIAPLPRAYQWIDGAGYLAHLDRVRSLSGSLDAELQSQRALLYQGGSDSLTGPYDDLVVPDEDLAIDFEAELAVILGPVAMGASKQEASKAIRLVTFCNDLSLRRLVTDDLKNGFGFFHAKPSTSFAPIVATPDELGGAWRQDRLFATYSVWVNDHLYGQLEAGTEMSFDFADLACEAARTRNLGAGTILGSGTIANAHDEVLPLKAQGKGFGCIAEARTAEKLKLGKARTPFMKNGDRLRMSVTDEHAHMLFGELRQKVSVRK